MIIDIDNPMFLGQMFVLSVLTLYPAYLGQVIVQCNVGRLL